MSSAARNSAAAVSWSVALALGLRSRVNVSRKVQASLASRSASSDLVNAGSAVAVAVEVCKGAVTVGLGDKVFAGMAVAVVSGVASGLYDDSHARMSAPSKIGANTINGLVTDFKVYF